MLMVAPALSHLLEMAHAGYDDRLALWNAPTSCLCAKRGLQSSAF